MRSFGIRCLVFVALLRVYASEESEAAKDAKASVLAIKRADDFCADVDLTDVDETVDRELLEGGVPGGTNIILESMKAANNTDELGDEIVKNTSPEFLVGSVGSLIFAVILFSCYFLWCWSACPCCRCCRCDKMCGKKPRKMRLPLKMVCVIVAIGLILGMIAAAFSAYDGKGRIEQGLNSIMCTAARVLKFTLNGYPEKKFIGMLPLLNDFTNLTQVLDDGSDFVTGIFGVLDSTAEIEVATLIAQEAVSQLETVLAANMNPVVGQQTPSNHKCILCESLGPPLSAVKTALNDGVGVALANARGEVEKQFGNESRAELRSSFSGSVKPVRDSATLVRNGMEGFLSDDFEDVKNQVISIAGITVISISLIVFLLMFCGCSSAVLLVLKDVKSYQADEPPPEPSRCIHPCAGCTWCGSWFYAVAVFFLGGIMIVINIPLSSLCLILDDLDGQMLKDIVPALQGKNSSINVNTAEFTMMTDMIDMCFSRKTPESDKTLMDALLVKENGTDITMTQKIQKQTTDMINSKFVDVETKLASDSVTLMDNAQLVSLITMLRETPISAMYISQPAELLENSQYSPMSGAPQGEMYLINASSLYCDDYTPNIDGLPSSTIMGINTLKSRMMEFSSSTAEKDTTPSYTCTKQVDSCNYNPGTNPPTTGASCSTPCAAIDACEAANALMTLKARVIQESKFRCDTFSKPDALGQPIECDIKDMELVGGIWTNDCLTTNADGKKVLETKVKEGTVNGCSLAEFEIYMQEWAERLTTSFSRMDSAVADTQSNIVTDMKNLVNTYILSPVNRIVSETSCNFLKKEYSDLVLGFCYKGVVGFGLISRSYVANGILTLFLIILSYFIWRHAIDNRNLWKDSKKIKPKPQDASPGKEAESGNSMEGPRAAGDAGTE